MEFNPFQKNNKIKGFMDLAKNDAIDRTFLDYDEETIFRQSKISEVITISDSLYLFKHWMMIRILLLF